MKINKRVQFVLLLLLLGLCTWNIITDVPSINKTSYNISIIIRGKMDDSWSNLKKGAETAAEDLNVNLRFVAAIEGNSAQEQLELFRQELVGTDAILLSPVRNVHLEDLVNESIQNKSLILIESDLAEEHTLPIIQSDNEGMGDTLAKTLIQHGVGNKRIVLLYEDESSYNMIVRQEGFMKRMESSQVACMITNVGHPKSEAIYQVIEQAQPEVVVALDTAMLEELVKANNAYKTNFPDRQVLIYGAGCSSALLKALENGEIVSLVAPDSFSIGYLGVQEAVNAIEKEKVNSNKNIRYILTDSKQMYDDVHQSLLFPFVR